MAPRVSDVAGWRRTILRPYLKDAAGSSELVFGRGPDQPFDPKTVGDRAERSWSQANPKAIQEFMGHATIEETFSHYGHLMPGARDQARELVDAYMSAAAA
jgi:integrase